MPTYVTVVQSFTVSSAFTLSTRGARPVAIHVASHAARDWYVAFSPDNGATWVRPLRPDGTGLVWQVGSQGGGILATYPYPLTLGRIECSSATATTTVAIIPLNH